MRRHGRWLLWVGLAVACTFAQAQVCRDLDADGYEAGHTCLSATDCADRSWRTHPAATEVCDGFDNDCDDLLDFGCDGLCEEPTLYPGQKVLEVDGFPEAIGGGCIARTERGHLVVSSRLVSEIGSPYDAVYHARAHDDDGEPWGPAYRVGVDPAVPPLEQRCEIASGGDIALVAYQDAQTRDAATYRLLVRLIDDMGRPLWNGPIDLSATAPVGSAPWVDQSVAWDGERFAVFWTPWGSRENLLVSFVETDGSATTSIVTSDIDGSGRDINMVSAVWTGDAYLVSLRMSGAATDNVFNVKVSPTGGFLTSVPLSTTAQGRVEMALANDRIALAWPGFPLWVWRVAMVDFDGNLLDPPGIVDLHSESAVNQSGNMDIVWTGGTFGTAFAVWEQQPLFYRWFFISIHPDGTLTPPNAALLSDAQDIADLWGLTWNGTDFRLFHGSGNNHFLEHRVVCSCQDLDGDMFNACTGLDCDDSDPFVNPFISEQCQGWVDDDCDGLIDCDDLGDCPGGAGPTDVTDLGWNGTDLVWTAPGGAQSYDLGRGLLSDLLRRGDTLQSECAGPELLGPSWSDDGRVPPPGDALWYLVRPEGVPCALGSWDGGDGAGRQVSVCR